MKEFLQVGGCLTLCMLDREAGEASRASGHSAAALLFELGQGKEIRQLCVRTLNRVAIDAMAFQPNETRALEAAAQAVCKAIALSRVAMAPATLIEMQHGVHRYNPLWSSECRS
jgi:hypothetical protein